MSGHHIKLFPFFVWLFACLFSLGKGKLYFSFKNFYWLCGFLVEAEEKVNTWSLLGISRYSYGRVGRWRYAKYNRKFKVLGFNIMDLALTSFRTLGKLFRASKMCFFVWNNPLSHGYRYSEITYGKKALNTLYILHWQWVAKTGDVTAGDCQRGRLPGECHVPFSFCVA